ncbi:MAG: FeS assembly SUF system protein SufT [Niastella sp. SCN 39-18]|nr:metal-sulfur cluster assembly factor [Sphingobacteriales bacterium]ODT53333.1 MAG: FeS assembly SUF system protein SufT [Niastella sp. SCN 39-18]OJW08598.1 MAG: FeS assembly SUF system protein SufT [Sphingobacteriales bacterium 39-19]
MTNVISNNNIKCTIALAGLQDVLDPEIGLNIVDLGLVYQIDFDEEGKSIFCSMTLTTQFCPMGESITSAAKESLKLTFPGYEPVIELTFDPPWNHEMISEEGRIFLNER